MGKYRIIGSRDLEGLNKELNNLATEGWTVKKLKPVVRESSGKNPIEVPDYVHFYVLLENLRDA